MDAIIEIEGKQVGVIIISDGKAYYDEYLSEDIY